MKVVFFLYHIDDQKFYDGVYHYGHLVGIYTTLKLARDGIRRLRNKPGFRDYPECWRIYKRTLGRDSWAKGFDRKTHRLLK